MRSTIMAKKLKKSTKDKWIAGVAGGMAEYFDMDPMLMRIIWIVGTLVTGGIWGIIIYIIMIFLMEEGL
ncbi:MAG: PspC domain-containing protein [Candidatus Thermoplasmatota archaeon]|nr:PspC domain-containing protein [Candidatus Thermoplasmatota archaeon]